MLKIAVQPNDYVFVYSHGQPIGLMRFESKHRAALVFAGSQDDFRVLRPRVVERLYGKDEVERLLRRFLEPRLAPAVYSTR